MSMQDRHRPLEYAVAIPALAVAVILTLYGALLTLLGFLPGYPAEEPPAVLLTRGPIDLFFGIVTFIGALGVILRRSWGCAILGLSLLSATVLFFSLHRFGFGCAPGIGALYMFSRLPLKR